MTAANKTRRPRYMVTNELPYEAAVMIEDTQTKVRAIFSVRHGRCLSGTAFLTPSQAIAAHRAWAKWFRDCR